MNGEDVASVAETVEGSLYPGHTNGKRQRRVVIVAVIITTYIIVSSIQTTVLVGASRSNRQEINANNAKIDSVETRLGAKLDGLVAWAVEHQAWSEYAARQSNQNGERLFRYIGKAEEFNPISVGEEHDRIERKGVRSK